MSKINILFVAADPLSASPNRTMLMLDDEVRQIRAAVRAAEYRGEMEFSMSSVARTDDLLQALYERRPQVVHFRGYGGNEGVVLTEADGRTSPVSAARLGQLLDVFGNGIQLVVLDACYANPQAEAIAAAIGCVVGTPASISDEGAITFTSAFYRALAFGDPVSAAFDQATTALALNQLDERSHPQMIMREGVDPSQMVLVRPGGANAPDSGSALKRADDDLLLVADLDAAPVELTVELMGALDELHRALGGGGLEIRSAHAGSAATVGMPV